MSKLKLKPQLTDSINVIIDKDKVEDTSLVLFDTITNCVLKECPIYNSCPYDKKKNISCLVRERYLDHCLKTLNSVPNKLDKLSMMKIGFSLIPLYSQLINFKILAHSLDSVMEGRKIHPIYREIRETIKLITTLLKDLAPDEKEQFDSDSSDYYNELFNEEQPKQKVFDRKFLKKTPKNSNIRNFRG